MEESVPEECSDGAGGRVVPNGDVVHEFAFVLGQGTKVVLQVFFLQPCEHLAFLHGLEQRLALLSDHTIGARDALLLRFDVALHALEIGIAEQHVGAAESLPLEAKPVLDALTAGLLLPPQRGLFGGQMAPRLRELLLENFFGMAANDEQRFESESKHGRIQKRERSQDRLGGKKLSWNRRGRPGGAPGLAFYASAPNSAFNWATPSASDTASSTSCLR